MREETVETIRTMRERGYEFVSEEQRDPVAGVVSVTAEFRRRGHSWIVTSSIWTDDLAHHLAPNPSLDQAVLESAAAALASERAVDV